MIEWQKQQKALKDAERDRKKNASSLLNNYRGGEHDIKDQKQQKAIKDAERKSKLNASSYLHSYRGGEHDIKDQTQQKAMKDAERDTSSKSGSSSHDVKDEEGLVAEERKYNQILEISEHDEPQITEDTKSIAADINSGKSRKPLSIDFSFGIIYPDYEPEPGTDLCASAASVIIPHVISQWTTETKIFCNPKKTEVIGDIDIDDWYDGDDESIRYKVKGRVAVQVFSESSANEVAEGLKKVLKRRVSFRPVSPEEQEEATKEKQAEIIGKGEQKWIRVRDGRLGGLGITF